MRKLAVILLCILLMIDVSCFQEYEAEITIEIEDNHEN